MVQGDTRGLQCGFSTSALISIDRKKIKIYKEKFTHNLIMLKKKVIDVNVFLSSISFLPEKMYNKHGKPAIHKSIAKGTRKDTNKFKRK